MPGDNIAMKIPAQHYAATVAFYEQVLGLERIASLQPEAVFQFGGKRLWLDSMEDIDQVQIWLEIHCEDLEQAEQYFRDQGIERCDQVEPLPDGFAGFWIKNPTGVIHLVWSLAE